MATMGDEASVAQQTIVGGGYGAPSVGSEGSVDRDRLSHSLLDVESWLNALVRN
jgi:hypothetical protein